MENKICCPKCGSDQITANQKGFSGGKALAGAVLTGGFGLLAGTIGSKKIVITCLSCGTQFNPGDKKKLTFYEKMDALKAQNDARKALQPKQPQVYIPIKPASKTQNIIALIISLAIAIPCGLITLIMLFAGFKAQSALWGAAFCAIPTFIFGFIAKNVFSNLK